MRCFLLLLALLVVGGCTLEPREATDGADPDIELIPDADAPSDTVPLPDEVPRDPEEAVAIVMEVFREATRVGDLSLALSILDREAILVDDGIPGGMAGPAPADPGDAAVEERTRGEFVMAMRRQHADGLRFQVDGVRARVEGPHALVVTSLRAERLDADEPDAGPTASWSVLETAVLRATDAGWRIVHLHRSGASGGAS